MIIDLILDRKDGAVYSPKKFYDRVMSYGNIWPELAHPIAEALDNGEEENVRAALCSYIRDNDYNHDITNYINSVNWL